MVRLLGGDEVLVEKKTSRLSDRDPADLPAEECNHSLGYWNGKGPSSPYIAVLMFHKWRMTDASFQIMLMRYINTLPAKDDIHRITVFLVPTVALVDQQSNAIAKNTSLRVRPYRGDMQVEFWDRKRWQEEFESSDCVVMTAQIWLDVLLHAYWSIDKVLLMVFDECHHAQKSHPYARIMDEYHRFKEEGHRPLPHILGLTASPVFNPKNPEEDFKRLEDKLDAILIGVRDEKVEAEGYVWKPIEKPLYYTDTGHYLPETDFEAMLDELEIWDMVDEEKIRKRIDNVKRVMGPLACDFYIMSWLWSVRDPVATKQSLRQIRASGRIHEVENLHNKMYQTLVKRKYYGVGDVSDKVKCLVDFLNGYRDKKGFHAIIFVEQRHHAQALALVLSKSQSLQQFVRVANFVGHGSTGEERLASEGMDAKHQRKVVEDFRNGDINLLVATNVAEEGLDFQACNVILRFDSMTTYKGYIQSRGRARKKDSEFIVMVERDSMDEYKWKSYKHAEVQLDKMYDLKKYDVEPEEPELENTPRYTNPKTGATLTYGNVIALLGEACALIPTDAYYPPSKPRFELEVMGKDQFRNHCFLPMMPLLDPKDRELTGPQVSTKKGAKQAAAFEACKLLHRVGVLDDHFLPLREGKGDLARDADDELVDRTALPFHMDAEMKNIFGNMWLPTQPPIWLNEVSILDENGKTERFGIICAERLNIQEPLTMHEPGARFMIRIDNFRKLSFSNADREAALAKFDKFTRWTIKQVINRKLISGPMLYLLSPLVELQDGAFDIDWATLANPFASISNISQLSKGNLVMAPWQFMRKHIFTIHAIRPDLNSLNMPRITGLTKRGRIFERTGNFGEALVALLDYEGIDLTGLDYTEGMLHLKPWFSVRNNLNPIKAHSEKASAATAPRAGETVALSPSEDLMQVDSAEDETDLPLQPWEMSDYKWRKYKVKQYEFDEEAADMLDPESSICDLQPLPAGQTTSNTTDMVNAFVLPWSLCKISNISIGVWNAFSWLPSLFRAIHDQMRTQEAMKAMGVPPLDFPLVTQALTLPMCCIGKDYQTLETIGDSALKLAVTVVVYNRYQAKDEGGLSARRMNSIDNQHLRMKALKKGLHNHMFIDFFRMRTWVPPTVDNSGLSEDGTVFKRTIPRRGMSDCIEAILGAAYLSGGFEAVLRTGDALGLCFGGSEPWHERYKLNHSVQILPVGPALVPLEKQLGYKFKHGQLLLQALTHRSFANAKTHCQEREEFLGDAVLDNFVIDRLSRRFPTATPSHLTRLRAVLVSNSALGYLSLKVLGLHRYLLHSTPLLTEHFNRALEEAQLFVHSDFVSEIWLFDPPKPAADAVESIIGSIFIDCGWHLEPVFDVLDRMFEDLFKLLPDKESAPRDPTSKLRMYLQSRRCKDLEIKTFPRPDIHLPAMIAISWHGVELAKTSHHSQASAKQLAAKIALTTIMKWGKSELERICTCKDDLAERVGGLRDWKKEAEVSMNLPKPNRKRDIDTAMEYDLGLPDERKKDAMEEKLEEVMKETYGYNPHIPQDEGEDANLQQVVADAETSELAQDLEPGSASSSFSSVQTPIRTVDARVAVPAAVADLMDVDEPGASLVLPLQAAVKPVRLDWEEESDDEDDDGDCLLITTSG